MISNATTVNDYIAELPAERQQPIQTLRQHILANLPSGFVEIMSYGMPSYVVPLSVYPPGYHCKQGQPLPYMSFASQKNYIAVYHLGLYTDERILSWFTERYQKSCAKKLSMGKSCIRLKDTRHIPYELFGELAKSFTVEQWIAHYVQRLIQ